MAIEVFKWSDEILLGFFNLRKILLGILYNLFNRYHMSIFEEHRLEKFGFILSTISETEIKE